MRIKLPLLGLFLAFFGCQQETKSVHNSIFESEAYCFSKAIDFVAADFKERENAVYLVPSAYAERIRILVQPGTRIESSGNDSELPAINRRVTILGVSSKGELLEGRISFVISSGSQFVVSVQIRRKGSGFEHIRTEFITMI